MSSAKHVPEVEVLDVIFRFSHLFECLLVLVFNIKTNYAYLLKAYHARGRGRAGKGSKVCAVSASTAGRLGRTGQEVAGLGLTTSPCSCFSCP